MNEGCTAELHVCISLNESGIATTDNTKDGVATDTIVVTEDLNLILVNCCLAVLTLKRQIERPLLVGALILVVTIVTFHTHCHVSALYLCEGAIATAEYVEVRISIICESILPDSLLYKVRRHGTIRYLYPCGVSYYAGILTATIDIMVVEEYWCSVIHPYETSSYITCCRLTIPLDEILCSFIPYLIPYYVGTIHIYCCLSDDIGRLADIVFICKYTLTATEYLAGEGTSRYANLRGTFYVSLVTTTINVSVNLCISVSQ